jgi:hypothetical protein
MSLQEVAAAVTSPLTACSARASLFLEAASAEADMSTFREILDQDGQLYEERTNLLRAKLHPSGTSVQRLKATETGAAFVRNLTCLRPARKLSDLSRRHSFDRDLLSLKLKRGRVCQHALCHRSHCGLHVRDGVITREEAEVLTAHGQGVLHAEGDEARDARRPYVRVDFMRSAQNGSLEGHVLMLRVAERVRRLAAAAFGLPLARVGVAETLLALRRTDMPRLGTSSAAAPSHRGGGAPLPSGGGVSSSGSVAMTVDSAGAATLADRGGPRWAEEAQAHDEGSETAYHCDESLAPHFHFSTIVWLSDYRSDFSGGELSFLYNRSWAWLVVEPTVGRAAFFSSGWENIHGIKPLESGSRWALSVPLMVNDELAQIRRARHVGEREREMAAADEEVDGEADEEEETASGEQVGRMGGQRFRDACVLPVDKADYQRCRAEWANELTPHIHMPRAVSRTVRLSA